MRVARAAHVTVGAVFVLVALAPILAVYGPTIASGAGLAAWRTVLSEARQWGLLRNTLVMAGGAALVATLLGAPAGCLTERHRPAGLRALPVALAAPLLVPPYVYAVIWAEGLTRTGLMQYGADLGAVRAAAMNPYTLTGAMIILGLAHFPVVAFATMAALRRYDRHLEEPARLVAGPMRTFFAVTAPILAPAVGAGALCVFLLCLVEFAVPSLLQVNVYAVEIHTRFSLSYDAAEAAAQSAPLVVCGAGVLAAWAFVLRPRYRRALGVGAARVSEGDEGRDSPASIGASVYCWGLVCMTSLFPCGALIAVAMPPSSFAEMWSTARGELGASLAASALSATFLTTLAFACAWAARSSNGARRLYATALVPFLVSGPIVGIGLIRLWNHPAPLGWVYDTPAILVLASSARFLVFAYLILFAALRTIPCQLDEAGAVLGISAARRLWRTTLPLAAPTLAVVWGLCFVLSLREVDAAVLVTPPGWTPLSVRVFSLMHYGPSRLVAALNVAVLALILGVATAALCFGYGVSRVVRERH